jgi:hypothetical protein
MPGLQVATLGQAEAIRAGEKIGVDFLAFLV